MSGRHTFLLGLLAALLFAVIPTTATAKPKAPKPSPAIARQIAALERTTNVLSAEIAALAARPVAANGGVTAPAPAAPAPAAILEPPTPAPPRPAGGDFTGSFPDPKLLPGTVGPAQLAEGSVDSHKVVDGAIKAAAIAPGGITGDLYASAGLERADFVKAIAGKTLARRFRLPGESALFELGVPHEQTLTLGANCPGRVISGGWKLVPGERGAQVMASVPSFISGGKTTEHDWVITVHEEFTETTIRNRLDTSALCIE